MRSEHGMARLPSARPLVESSGAIVRGTLALGGLARKKGRPIGRGGGAGRAAPAAIGAGGTTTVPAGRDGEGPGEPARLGGGVGPLAAGTAWIRGDESGVGGTVDHAPQHPGVVAGEDADVVEGEAGLVKKLMRSRSPHREDACHALMPCSGLLSASPGTGTGSVIGGSAGAPTPETPGMGMVESGAVRMPGDVTLSPHSLPSPPVLMGH